jgi:hypothetical protein
MEWSIEWCFTRVDSRLTRKYKTRVKLFASEKYSCLFVSGASATKGTKSLITLTPSYSRVPTINLFMAAINTGVLLSGAFLSRRSMSARV